jgi:hypothetical protein
MTQKLRLAICQFPVSGNLASNAKFIRRFMKEAADAAAHVVHFPETALSGYECLDFTPVSANHWQDLEEHTKKIVNLAGKLGLWVVLGSCRRVAGRDKPANCLHVISNTGRIVGTYDKQKLTAAEVAWYTPGKGLLVISINGLKCDIHFQRLVLHDPTALFTVREDMSPAFYCMIFQIRNLPGLTTIERRNLTRRSTLEAGKFYIRWLKLVE